MISSTENSMDKKSPGEALGAKRRMPHQFKLLCAFMGMCVIFSVANPQFITLSNLLNVFRQASTLFMLACGQTLVLLVAGIDLSQGSVVGLVSVMTALGLIKFGLVPGVLLGLLTGTVSGFIIGLVITKAKVVPFVVTLGMLFIAEGATLFITDGQPVFGIPHAVSKQFFFIGGGYLGPVPFPIILFALALLTFFFILKWTRLGRYLYAIGGNEDAAHLSGINLDNVKILVYTLNGALVALGSIILTSRVNSGQPLLGGDYLMESIGAVVIGGTSLFGGRGGVLQTCLGVCFIAFMVNGLNILGVSSFVKQMLIGILMIGAVFLTFQSGRGR